MTTVTLWLLISLANSTRPPVVIERFHSEQQCKAAQSQYDAVSNAWVASACIRVEAAR